MKTTLVTHLRSRGRLVALSLALGAFGHACAKLPRERSLDALHELASEASQSQASAGAWEPSRGTVLDLLDGRGFLFLGREGEQRDVQRAFIRVSPDGAPLSVTRVRKLTDTELADERSLAVRGSRAAFATVTGDDVQSVSLLDTDKAPPHGATGTPFARAQRVVDSFLTTGSPLGIARTDLVFDAAPRELAFTLSQQDLELSQGEVSVKVPTRIEARRGRLVAGGGKGEPGAFGVTALERAFEPRPLGEFLGRTTRALFGERVVDGFETARLAARDRARRLISKGERPRPPAAPEAQGAREPSAAGEPRSPWPPADVPSVFETPRDGEGRWVAVPLAEASSDGGKSPPHFHRTFVRADRERPSADVVLIAMDMRRLELAYEAGSESPRASAGVAGAGRIAGALVTPSRVVATFNGAVGGASERSGAVVARRVLSPPVPFAPTVRIDRSGRVGLGAWLEPSSASAAPGLALPDELVSLRQGLRPLVVKGEIAPPERPRSPFDDVVSERSALCVTFAGHLLYAWTSAGTLQALSEALQLAGCDFALSLTEREGDSSFVLTDVTKLEPLEARTSRLDPRMSADEARHLRGSARDFFYVSLRESTPRAGAFEWQIDAGAQPPPAGAAAVFSTRQTLGALSVLLTRFEAGRFAWRVSAAAREAKSSVIDNELPSAERERVVARIALGHTTEATRYGLAVSGTVAVPFQRALATLVFPRRGTPHVVPPGLPFELPDGAEAVQLPLLAQGAELTPRARDLGALRKRGALCLDGTGNLLVARLEHDSSAPAARVLAELGCELVLEMDRGSHSAPTLERAGAHDVLAASAASTMLYALSREPEARAYSFGAGSAQP